MSLRIAFAKGRGALASIRLLEEGGFRPPSSFYEGRLSVYRDTRDLECFLVRGQDLGWYVRCGYVDLGIGSNIVIEEYDASDLIQIASLDIGVCRLSLITCSDQTIETIGCVCTRFPSTASRKLRGLRSDIRIVPLAGCAESALLLGVCDAIVDIVETGWTLGQLGLKERATVFDVHHGIWMRRDRLDLQNRLKTLMPTVAWDREIFEETALR